MLNNKSFRSYRTVGFLIILSLFAAVWAVRFYKGMPKAIAPEPTKTMGAVKPLLSITEYSDFACPYCAVVAPALKQMVSENPDEIQLVFKHFPLNSHPSAWVAAEAAECAGDQNKFWDYHDILYSKVEEWNENEKLLDILKGYGQALGLNEAAFNQCLESNSKKEAVIGNKKEGKRFLISGTPTCILNHKRFLVAFEPEAIKKEIEAELAKVKKI